MQRRDFCKLAAAVAASSALPLHAQSSQAAAADLPPGFDKLTEDYAQFCATPANQRTFYALVNGKIVSQMLDEATWYPVRLASEKRAPLPVPGGSWDSVPMKSPIPGLSGDGPFKPTWESLLDYDAPEWYRDAKFGIWAHWSPQCVPEDGDWYARNMYIQGSKQYKYQLAHYGPPSQFGYKDLCPQWTLLNWQPDALMDRFHRAGARFFLTLANHHDGFDTWNSKHQPWNAVALGPRRDVVGTWAHAARKRGMRFGVTVHQARNWWWFQPSHGADKDGPLAGVPYDGDLTMAQGKNQWWQGLDPHRIYGVKHPPDAIPDISYVKNFYDRTRDLIDQHNPDLLYFDNARVPLGWAGMNIAAYYYNKNIERNHGKLEAVLNAKIMPPRLLKALVADIERGLTRKIMPYPWQSETGIGDWHYQKSLYQQPGEYGGYLHPQNVIHWLVDTVSKNGTFVLNIPGKPDGTIDSKEIAVLDKITAWMQINGDAIYATRPWKVYGEGPNIIKAGSFLGGSITRLTAQDIRFTRNKSKTVIHAIFMGWPEGPVQIKSLGSQSPTQPGKIERVQLLGTEEQVHWKQQAHALRVELPSRYRPPVDFAAVLKVTLA